MRLNGVNNKMAMVVCCKKANFLSMVLITKCKKHNFSNKMAVCCKNAQFPAKVASTDLHFYQKVHLICLATFLHSLQISQAFCQKVRQNLSLIAVSVFGKHFTYRTMYKADEKLSKFDDMGHV